MGFMGSLIGTQQGNTGGAGMRYSAGMADIAKPFSQAQLNDLYGQTQGGLNQQQAFINALQAQGGVGNQASVFQQQQALANQLQQAAQGGGPNPAAAQLAQATGQNVAQQSAMMGSQRGAGANAGLLARQAAMQGSQIQQNAAGQAAALNAQQQIAARQQLGQQQAMMGNLSTQQVGQQQAALNAYNQGLQNYQSQLLGAASAYNNAQVGAMGSMNAANAGVAGQVAGQQGSMLGGIMNGAAMALMAHGGEVQPMHNYAEGGEVDSGPSSFAGKFLSGWGSEAPQINTGIMAPQQAIQPAGPMVSSQPMIQFRQKQSKNTGDVQGFTQPEMGSQFAGSAPTLGAFSNGGKVPGEQEVKTDKNTYSNDTVPAMLSPGEVVIPVSVMKSKDPVANAAKFVQAILAKQGMKKNG